MNLFIFLFFHNRRKPEFLIIQLISLRWTTYKKPFRATLFVLCVEQGRESLLGEAD